VSGGPSVLAANIVVQKVPYKTVFLSRKYGLTTTAPGHRLVRPHTVGDGPGYAAPRQRSRTWSKPYSCCDCYLTQTTARSSSRAPPGDPGPPGNARSVRRSRP
jgi:hypothetical protein